MRHLVTVLRDPVAWILVAAGVVELIAGGTAARGAILFAGAGLILAERIRAAVARSHPSAPSFILRAAPLVRR